MLKFTWYGTNSFKLFDDNTSIIFDPFIRYSKRNDNSYVKNLNEEKHIFITHGHIDHILDIPSLYKDKECRIYCLDTIYKRLKKRGLKDNQLAKINYNDKINIDNFKIKVYKSKHIKFNIKLIIDTLFNFNMVKYFKNGIYLGFNHIKNPLRGSIAAYEIKYNNLNIFVMGSMNLDNDIDYPKNMDYLIIAFQGRSDLNNKIKSILHRLQPKKIILTHFDNSFPPISKNVNIDNIKRNKSVIVPKYEKSIELN